MYEELWVGQKGGPRSWASYLKPDELAWLEGLADQIRLKGSEPFWKPVAEAFWNRFPDAEPATAATVMATVRKLV